MNWFQLAHELVQNYYLNNSIDMYHTFWLARKSLNIKYLPKFEELVSLLPKNSSYL